MFKFARKQRIEFQVVLGLVGIAALNSIIFTGISTGEITRRSSFESHVIPTVHILILLAMIICILFRRTKILSYLFYFLLFFITIDIISNLYLLIVNPHISDNGAIILTEALLIWINSLLVFNFWYWLVDRGGPVARAEESDKTRYDLLFPQYQSHVHGWGNWKPHFIDYLFFSFFTSTGFSPADTLPLTKRAKLLMMVEATISLIIIGMVASRAISLIQ